MKQKEELEKKEILTEDQIKEIMSYPSYWQNTLEQAAKKGKSIK